MTTQNITITDTGKRSTSSLTSEETDLANNGDEIVLKGVNLSYGEEAILNTNASVGLLEGYSSTAKFTIGEVDKLGVKIPKWTVEGVLDINDATDLATIKVLRDLVRTKGYKILKGDVPDYVDGVGNSSGVNVRVGSLSITSNSGESIIRYSLTLWETG